jgi:hypothetical protein
VAVLLGVASDAALALGIGLIVSDVRHREKVASTQKQIR